MTLRSPYRPADRYWRANLHTHTSLSDGALAPELVCAKYQEAGYHILALTDHERLTRCPHLAAENFLTIPAAEVGWPHVVHLGARTVVEGGTLPITLKAIAREGGLAVIAHPVSLAVEALLTAAHYQAIEIVNFFCLMHHEFDPPDGGSPEGEAVGLWDDLLRAGRRVWGVAADDAHFREVPDFAGAWVWVEAEELSEAEVLAALGAGRFYSSEGPRVEQIRVSGGGEVCIRTSPVVEVRLVTADPEVTVVRRLGPADARSFSLSLGDLGLMRPGYVRVELRDEQGRRAWLNPFFIEEQ